MSKFSKSLGVWELPEIDGIKVELKPRMKDIRLFRSILVSDDNRKNKDLLFNKFSDMMVSMIKEAEPVETEEEIRHFVELNVNRLFEDAMIAFRWTTKEEMEKSKREGLTELKKSMSSV